MFLMFYSQAQWLLFFFLYCFLGWVWECLYVSAIKRHWINRGFLYGPLIPIYGSGAITVLWITLPVRRNIPLIFLLGMVGATVLEYFTGAAMERIFHVRYWDYSSNRFNLNGYICLFSSLGWGLFSVLMVKVLHPPFENAVLKIPENIANLTSTVLVAIFAADTTKSVQSALDLRELLQELTERSAVLSSLEYKLENVSENIAQNSEKLHEHIHEIESEFRESREILSQKRERIKSSYKKALHERLKERKVRTALNIIRRNPSAISPKFKESFHELKELFESQQQK